MFQYSKTILGLFFLFTISWCIADENSLKSSQARDLATSDKSKDGAKQGSGKWVEMTIDGVSKEVHSGAPVVVLRSENKDQFLLVFIGPNEAAAIVRETAGFVPVRPMTHDLLSKTISSFGGKVEKVMLTKLQKGIFYAKIMILHNGASLAIDARPSDSMALAVRVQAPIFVAEEILEKAGQKRVIQREPRELELYPIKEALPEMPLDAI